MKTYVEYLLKDIAAAHRKKEAPKEEEEKPLDFDIEAHFREVEQFLAGAISDEHTFAYYTGLKKEVFPPAEKLNGEQMQTISNAFEELLASWNLVADFPEPLPVSMAYRTLIDILDRAVTIVDSGTCHLEFCDYEPENCQFKEYCTCKDLDFDSSFEQTEWEKEKAAKKEEKAKRRALEEEEMEQRRQVSLAKLSPEERAAIDAQIAKMGKYLDYLIQDIKIAIQNVPPSSGYSIQNKDGIDKFQFTELAETPYKTVEEWTGISLDALATECSFTGPQLDKLVHNLDKLWATYHFSFDLDDDLDDSVLRYRMYIDCWLDLVQYLPTTGFEVQVCAGNSSECRMGLDCICLHDPPFTDDDFDLPKNTDYNPDDNDLPF